MEAGPGVRRLHKSRSNRMIDGVCGGLSEFFALDPTLVRIAAVLLALFGGIGILLYIVAMIITPAAPAMSSAPAMGGNDKVKGSEKFWGILLVCVGIFWLLSNLGLPVWHRWWGFSWDVLLPLLLILAGVGFLFGGRNYISSATASETGSSVPHEGEPGRTPAEGPTMRRLFRSRIERKFLGVCGGLGIYFNIDPTIVRLFFVVSAFASFGLTLLIYVIMAIVVPDEPKTVHVT